MHGDRFSVMTDSIDFVAELVSWMHMLQCCTVVGGIGDFTDGTRYCVLPEAVNMHIPFFQAFMPAITCAMFPPLL